MTRIAILGAGALGLLLAAKLNAANLPAVVWTRTGEQAAEIRKRGIRVEGSDGGRELDAAAAALPFPEGARGFDGYVLLTVKQTALTEPFLRELEASLAQDAVIVLFQNGIGHAEKVMAAVPGRRVLAAVTTEGALRIGPASVRHAGKGATWIGPWETADSPAEATAGNASIPLAGLLEQAGFSVFVSNDIRERMLRKLLMNAVINPLTALWRVPNGELTATSERVSAMRALFRETADILRGHGLRHPEDELWTDLLALCAGTRGNRSSMLQDAEAGRVTEIDALNGEVARMAETGGKPAPWNAVVTALVKAIRSTEERGP